MRLVLGTPIFIVFEAPVSLNKNRVLVSYVLFCPFALQPRTKTFHHSVGQGKALMRVQSVLSMPVLLGGLGQARQRNFSTFAAIFLFGVASRAFSGLAWLFAGDYPTFGITLTSNQPGVIPLLTVSG